MAAPTNVSSRDVAWYLTGQLSFFASFLSGCWFWAANCPYGGLVRLVAAEQGNSDTPLGLG